MLKLQLSARRFVRIAGAVALGATLTACGHHHGDSSQPAPTPSAVMQFINMVLAAVNSANADTKEPDDVSGVTPATTETDEPAPLS